MSYHRTPELNTPEIQDALKAHNLPVDEPSQLADTFRIGWAAAVRSLANSTDK